ncbi:MAG TPA: winged helix-turn-helix domain-containing protein [Rhizomicrobium sp.]|jgi:DNA-binding transcriptional ArsR family regulator|nr:winged helix-turn-helix domain-containing protein [Rhizomicrobium sp.]
MKDGPSLAPVAALVGDPARANMLSALAGGKALTASELAQEAGITAPTASSHLAKLEGGGLVTAVKQGRHRYFRLADADVAEMLEKIMGVASRTGTTRVRPGPSEPAMREARVCYDHLAGEMGVRLYDSLIQKGALTLGADGLALTPRGERFARDFGIDLDVCRTARRPLCRGCLDWSMRREHLAGSLGAAMLSRVLALKWARRDKNSRALLFTPEGKRKFHSVFAVTR